MVCCHTGIACGGACSSIRFEYALVHMDWHAARAALGWIIWGCPALAAGLAHTVGLALAGGVSGLHGFLAPQLQCDWHLCLAGWALGQGGLTRIQVLLGSVLAQAGPTAKMHWPAICLLTQLLLLLPSCCAGCFCRRFHLCSALCLGFLLDFSLQSQIHGMLLADPRRRRLCLMGLWRRLQMPSFADRTVMPPANTHSMRSSLGRADSSRPVLF